MVHFLDESFSEDFIQGLSLTQSFVHHGGDTEYTDDFVDHSAVGGVVQPGSLEADIDLWHADISMHPVSVPEPGSLLMLLTALGGLGWMSRRRSSQ